MWFNLFCFAAGKVVCDLKVRCQLKRASLNLLLFLKEETAIFVKKHRKLLKVRLKELKILGNNILKKNKKIMKRDKLRRVSLDYMIDKHIGEIGTEKRDAFEEELRLDILGQKIKEIREERHLTQAQLGELVGVKKAQISKIENNLTDARFETILKVFRALNAKINFNVEIA